MRFLLVFSMLFISIKSHAAVDYYTIIAMNMDSIKVGSHYYKIGDSFSGNQTIHWEKKSNAMKVRSKNTGKLYKFGASNFNKDITTMDY